MVIEADAHKHTHAHAHTLARPACALSSAVVNVGVLMLGKFLSRLGWRGALPGRQLLRLHIPPHVIPDRKLGGESAWDRRTHKHMYSEAHMHQLTITHTHTHMNIYRGVGAEELERLDVTGLIIEGWPLKLLHTRAQKIKLSYQWAALPSLLLTFSFSASLLSPSLHFLFFFLPPCLSWKAGLKFWRRTERAFQLSPVSVVMVWEGQKREGNAEESTVAVLRRGWMEI